MNTRIALPFVFAVAALVIADPVQSFNEFKTNDGSFLLRFRADRKQKFSMQKDGSQTFSVSGVTGYSKTQQIDYEADSVKGTLRPVTTDGKRGYLLDSATLSGDVKLSTRQAGSGTQVLSPTVQLAESPAMLKVTFPTRFTIRNESSKASENRSLVASAASGWMELEPFASKATQRLQKGELSEAVEATIDTTQTVTSEDGKSRTVKSLIKVKANKATLEAKGSTYVFRARGNVRIDGTREDGESLQGTMTLDQATFVLSQTWELIEFDGGSDD